MGINLGNAAPAPANLATQTMVDNSTGAPFLNLEKNQELDLTKVASMQGVPNYTKLNFGLGWDPIQGKSMDLDASIVVVSKSTKSYVNTCYYKKENNSILNGAITTTGDNLTGDGEGDDETLKVLLNGINKDYILFAVVNIFNAESKRQSFKDVGGAYVRLINGDNNYEVCRYPLKENGGDTHSVVFGALSADSMGNWNFQSIGEFLKGDLNASIRKCVELASNYQ